MKTILLGTVVYMFATFITQGVSHFTINRTHYAAVTFMRAEPIFALGMLSMVIQGAILTYLYPRYARGSSTWSKGLGYGLLLGAFFVSYLALAEPAKFQVPAILPWTFVESVTGLVQFGLFGLILGMMHQKSGDEGQPGTIAPSAHV